jgi:hypothetical protein
MKSILVPCVLLGLVAGSCADPTATDDAGTPTGGSAGSATGGSSETGGSGDGSGGIAGSGSGGGAGRSTGGDNGTGFGGAVGSGGLGQAGRGGAAGGFAGGSGGRTGNGGTTGGSGGAAGGPAGSTGAGGALGGAGGRATGGTGGAAAGAGGHATGGGTAGGGSTGGCGVDPVTPNATAKTRAALCYLYQAYGDRILAGQEENNDDDGMNYIYANTGKYPAIRAFDVNNSMAPTQCVAHSKNNGLCMFGYHMGIVNGDGYQSAMTKTDINMLLTEGSTYNQTFKTRLDNVARMVQTVQDADGVAIMRLFHEAGGTWFWWSMEGGAQYVRVYTYAFNYLTLTKGLRNMIWLLPYDGSPDPSFYPGKSVVDIGGADIYAGNGNYDPQNALYKKCIAVFGSSMPIALHECGPIPDPAQLMTTGTHWVFFNVWTAPYYQSPSNSVSHLQSVYTSSYVVTRDEMPVL